MASKRRNFEPSSGWEEDVTDHKNLTVEIIKTANNIYSLERAFKKYNISLFRSHNLSGWEFKGACPFPDHTDKDPSFGYNPSIGIFNCFGCHRNGGAVEFISYMERRFPIDVAREIVGRYSSDEISLHNFSFNFEKLQELLFDFADTIRQFKRTYNSSEAVEYAKAITWNLDVYLRKNAPTNTIVLENLEARINKLKSQLEVFGEPD